MKKVNMRNLTAAFFAILMVSNGCVSTYKLTVEDALARPGDKARLSGRLLLVEATVMNQKAEKQDLAFYVDNLLVGMNETNRDGYATVGYRTKELGVKQVKVIFTGRTFQTQSLGRVFVWKKNSPVLMVDVDGMVCRKNNVTMPLAGEDLSKTSPGAAETLRELSHKMHIVYLTSQPRENIPRTRTWLIQNDFPAGPVLMWDLDKIQADFPNARVGIGNTDKVYQAYRERKIFSILLDPTKPAEQIDGGVRVGDWNAVPKIFPNKSK